MRRRLEKLRRLISRQKEQAENLPSPILLANAVIVRISGGLANQMLCYKLARYVAGLKQSSVVLDATPLFGPNANPTRNFQLDAFPIRYDALITSADAMRAVRSGNEVSFVTREMLNDKSAAGMETLHRFIATHGVVYLDLWAAFYLRRQLDEAALTNGALADLTLPESKLDIRDRELLADIRQAANPVAIHVRRGDFETHDGNLLLTSGYYNRAIADLEERIEDPIFLVFSDDIDWCRKNLRFGRPARFVDWHDDASAYKDMFLASQCAHFILSNESTFSHQMVQLNRSPRAERIVIVSTAADLVKNQS